MQGKKLIAAFAALLVTLASVILLIHMKNIAAPSKSVEALSGCEVKRGTKVIYLCTGETGSCYAEKHGFSIVCSGKEVKTL